MAEILEKAAPQDESLVKTLLAECELPTQDLTPEHLEHFLLLKMDGELIGCVGLEIYGPNGLLRSLAIRQRQRGHGAGKYLVREAESYARAKGVGDIFLLTTTAERFFTHLGYRKTDRKNAPDALQSSSEFQSTCPASATCLTKDLG